MLQFVFLSSLPFKFKLMIKESNKKNIFSLDWNSFG